MRRYSHPKVKHARIGVIGLGEAGGKAIKRLVSRNYYMTDFVVMDTDIDSLRDAIGTPHVKPVLIGDRGDKSTLGMGTKGSIKRGVHAAAKSAVRIKNTIKEYDMLFLIGGLGGGTASGALPVVAKIAKDLGILTVALVTTPFSFEEKSRLSMAHACIKNLKQMVDTLIVVPNDRLHQLTEQKVNLESTFEIGDSLLDRCIQVIEQLTQYPSLINMDFADVESIMKNQGAALMTMGIGRGKNRATDAAVQATVCPILDMTMRGAKNVLLHLVISPDVDLFEIEEACNVIKNEAGADAYLKWGVSVDECMSDEVRILLVATNFNELTNFVVSMPKSVRKVVDAEREKNSLSDHFWSMTDSQDTPMNNKVFVYDSEPRVQA